MHIDASLGYSFLALFVIIDPIGTAALFLGLTHGMSESYRREMAARGVVVAGVLLLFFAFAGEILLQALGIGLAAFRIAGGVLLFLLAIDMVVARQSGLRTLTKTENREADREARARHDISVFPLAIPLIAGPGGLTTMVLLMGQAGGNWSARIGLIAVLAAVLAITYALLLAANRLVKILGTTGVNAITRVLGILLAALAVQFVLDGLVEGLRLG